MPALLDHRSTAVDTCLGPMTQTHQDPPRAPTSNSRSFLSRRGSAILLGLCLVALTAQGGHAVLTVPIVMTHDGPQHLHSALVESRYDSSAPLRKTLHHQAPLTANGFRLVFRPLETLFGWRTAYQLVIGLIALMWVVGLAALVLALERRRAWVIVAGFAVAFNWPLYMGFFNYCLGASLALCLVALILRADLDRRIHLLLISLGLLVIAWIHVFGAMAAGVFLVLTAGLGATGRLRWRRLGKVALVGAPAAGLATLVTLTLGNQTYDVGTTWGPDALWNIGGLFVAGPQWRRWLVGILGLIGFGAALTFQVSRRAPAVARPLVVGIGVFALLSAATPLHGSAWHFLSPRFLPFVGLPCLALLPLERLGRPWQRTLAISALLALSAASVGWAARYHQRQVDACAPVVRALDAKIRRSGLRSALVLDTCRASPGPPMQQEVPYQTPLHHLDCLMAAAHGGVALQLFSRSHALHAFTHRSALGHSRPSLDHAVLLRQRRRHLSGLVKRCADKPADAPACNKVRSLERLREAVLSYHASAAVEAEDIALYSRVDHDWFRQRGFVPDYVDGPLFLGRFVGCDLSVGINNPPAAGRAVTVSYGWYPLDLAKRTRSVVVPDPRPPFLTVPLERPPCGAVWIRVHEDRDGDGRLSPGDRVCQRADRQGRNVVENRRALRGVRCTLAPWK